MMVFAKLLDIIQREGIFLDYLKLKDDQHKLLGLYFTKGDQSFIVLDESLKGDEVMHIAVMAEEVGHHFGRRANLFHSSKVDILGSEVDALRWAVRFLASQVVRLQHSRILDGLPEESPLS